MARRVRKKLGENAATTYAKEVGKDVAGKAVAWAAGIGAVYFLIIRPVLQSVGVIKTKEEKQQEKQEQEYATGSNSPFNPAYYKQAGSGALLVTKAVALQLAKELYDAHGFFNDDEEQVYGALRQLKAKTQLSWVADVFYQQYKQDLYTYLRSFLDDSEMKIVNGIATNLK